jgi:hypothetical protein
MKRIVRFALFGAIGFGIGGALGGIISPSRDVPYVGFPILGFIGGASLGLALRDWKRFGLLALGCAIGFGIGFIAAFLTLFGIWEPPYVKGLFLGVVVGSVGGTFLGLVLKVWRSIGFLALAGSVGFGAIMQFISPWSQNFELLSAFGWWPKFTIWGVFGGAFLGAALGYLEKRKAERQRRSYSA